jgi:hypothetical protein
MLGSAAVSDFDEALSRVSFVNFNYDRCLENYLYNAIRGYCGFDPSHRDSFQRLIYHRTHHPYGLAGNLPLGQPPGSSIAFGEEELDSDRLRYFSKYIRTFSERREDGEDLRIKKTISEADQIIFLGCALHRQNFDLLRPVLRNFTDVYGTCYLPAPPDLHSKPSIETFSLPLQEAMRREMLSWPAGQRDHSFPNMVFEPLTCRQFIQKHKHRWVE